MWILITRLLLSVVSVCVIMSENFYRLDYTYSCSSVTWCPFCETQRGVDWVFYGNWHCPVCGCVIFKFPAVKGDIPVDVRLNCGVVFNRDLLICKSCFCYDDCCGCSFYYPEFI